ncbi:hypothetical protein ABPG72_006396 [Tetrahymena utriculariae]
MIKGNNQLSEQNTDFTLSQQLTLAYNQEITSAKQEDVEQTIEQFDQNEQITEPYKPNQLIECLTFPNQQTINISSFQQNVSKLKSGEIKKHIFNIDYIFQKFQEVKEKLDYSKGGYSDINVVKDQKDRILIRKTVSNPTAFLNELQFFQSMENKYLVNIYYYSKCDKEFYLEKGDETLYSFFKINFIKNRFFLFLLCLAIIEGVISLHLSNIFHGDIKPHNIIIFYKEGFNLDKLKEDQNISIKEIKQFLAIKSFLNIYFNRDYEPAKKLEDNNHINFNDFFSAIYDIQTKNTKIKLKYESFSQMLEKIFFITIKFIDFQSSSQLNTPQKIYFYTKAYTCEEFINKKKNEYLNFIDKIYVDHYSTLRTIMMISNFQSLKIFNSLDNSSIINNTEDFILKSLFVSYQQNLLKYLTDKNVNQTTKKLLIQLPNVQDSK